LIFYLGHTATFFINKLILAGLISERINPAFESMFAVGVDEMSWDDLSDSHYQWPTVQAVKDYRQQVRTVVDDIIRHTPLTSAIDWDHPWWPIVMGIEHERIHLETSSVLIRQHALHFVKPHPEWPICQQYGDAPINDLVNIPAGQISLKKEKTDAYYGWDNEFGEHHAHIPEFHSSRYLVSNQEFLAFVEAGGYQEACFWQDEGLAWKNYSQAQHPTFWLLKDQQWFLRLMTEEVAMPWSWPVEVNYHEAKAFCQWKTQSTGQSIRLPTEDEWYRLYDAAKLDEVPPHTSGKRQSSFRSLCLTLPCLSVSTRRVIRCRR
jgi:5-histidylcysteine sulfoxide synthase